MNNKAETGRELANFCGLATAIFQDRLSFYVCVARALYNCSNDSTIEYYRGTMKVQYRKTRYLTDANTNIKTVHP